MSFPGPHNRIRTRIRGRQRRSGTARLLAYAVAVLALTVACNGASGPVVGVSGTWVAGARATPLATPAAALNPFSTPAASAPASPAATTGGTPSASPATPFAATPQPDTRVSATLAKGVGPNGQPVDPSDSFAPDTAKIYLVFQAHGLPSESHLEAIWIADRVDAPVPAGYEVTRSTIAVRGDQTGNFSLSKPNPGFPLGQYHVDLYLDGTLVGSFPFTIK
ncbi:MAG TPA: hypothetical protein VFI42_06510 [Thermomicrobiaceae bacterium]|nr:hypothetical protein [Thermomicrobiaceae bacterium]